MRKIDVGTRLEFKWERRNDQRVANRIDTDGFEYVVTNLEYADGNINGMWLQSKKSGKGIRFTMSEVYSLFKIKR